MNGIGYDVRDGAMIYAATRLRAGAGDGQTQARAGSTSCPTARGGLRLLCTRARPIRRLAASRCLDVAAELEETSSATLVLNKSLAYLRRSDSAGGRADSRRSRSAATSRHDTTASHVSGPDAARQRGAPSAYRIVLRDRQRQVRSQSGRWSLSRRTAMAVTSRTSRPTCRWCRFRPGAAAGPRIAGDRLRRRRAGARPSSPNAPVVDRPPRVADYGRATKRALRVSGAPPTPTPAPFCGWTSTTRPTAATPGARSSLPDELWSAALELRDADAQRPRAHPLRVSDGFDETWVVSDKFSVDGRRRGEHLEPATGASASAPRTSSISARHAYDDLDRFLDGRSVTWLDGKRVIGTGRLPARPGSHPDPHDPRPGARRPGHASPRRPCASSSPAPRRHRRHPGPARVSLRPRCPPPALLHGSGSDDAVAERRRAPSYRGRCDRREGTISVPIWPGRGNFALELRAQAYGRSSTVTLLLRRL